MSTEQTLPKESLRSSSTVNLDGQGEGSTTEFPGKPSGDGWGVLTHQKGRGKANPVISNTWKDEPPTV